MPSDASQQIMAAVFGVCVAVLVSLLLRKEWQHKRESTQQQ
jgi:membrane associated rhomboid family serine protease